MLSQLSHKQRKWDQPVAPFSGPLGVQDPKKTCNLETYLDWSARLRLFVCNEILQVGLLPRLNLNIAINTSG